MLVTMIDDGTCPDRFVSADLPLSVGGRDPAYPTPATLRLPYRKEELRIRILLLDRECQMNVPPRLVPNFSRSNQKLAPRSLRALPHIVTALLHQGLRVLFPRLVLLLLWSGLFSGLTGSIHFVLRSIHFVLRLLPSGLLCRLPNSIRCSVHAPPPCQNLVRLSSPSDGLVPHVNGVDSTLRADKRATTSLP